MIFKSNLTFSQINTCVHKTFELIAGNLYIVLFSDVMKLIVIYRPPRGIFHEFLDEFSSLLENVLFSKGRLLIAGIFNVHVDNPADSDALKFDSLLNSMGLTRHVIGPTHSCRGHTLDLVITRIADPCVSDLKFDWLLPSDHTALHFSTVFARPRALNNTRATRRLANIDMEYLRQNITSSLHPTVSAPHCSPSDLVNKYNNILTSIIDEVAPVTTKTFLDKVRAPLFNEKLLEARRGLRQMERCWRKSGLVVHEQMFIKSFRCSYVSKLRDAHASYHRDRIVGADTGTLFRVIDEITGTKRTMTVTPDLDLATLPEMFADFFHRKIETIRENMPSIPALDHVSDNDFCFSSFELVSVHFVERLINKLFPKSSVLDPMPTELIKQCSYQITPAITHIINTSLQSCVFPQPCKFAIVQPLIKKQGLDCLQFTIHI